jgi:hypothetical protein
MKKKQYFAPELELLILEQTDIITNSPPVSGGIGGGTGGSNPGGGDDFGDFGWGD